MPATRLLRGLGLVAAWLVVSVAATVTIFANSERAVVVASHDTLLRPNLTGTVVVHSGPVLPDVRADSGHLLGVDITLGHTNAADMGELLRRYAVIASQPQGSIAKVEDAVREMALVAASRGAVVGLLPVAVWLLIGRARRRELWRSMRSRRTVAVGTVLAVAGALLWEPWVSEEAGVAGEQTWLPLQEYLGGTVPVPRALEGVEVRTDQGAIDTRRLVESAVATYNKSTAFYRKAANVAAGLELRQPAEDETVVVLVSDRHDNIGMDQVARAIGDRAGAEAVFDAGDDTSTGSRWEAFSLDSVSATFEGYKRYGVLGNHDNGQFVRDYLADQGWTMLEGEPIDGPGGGTLIGVDDPRSSGLGTWRDEAGLTFSEVGDRLSDAICDTDERVSTVLVHDVDLAQDALDRGCADLVVGGHVHVRIGPDRVVGENGEVGYAYTTGTTGGAAYALAIGSKPRRDAMVSLITYRDDRPVGIQPVTLQTNGTFVVSDYVELTY